jgi:hypothetical protein
VAHPGRNGSGPPPESEEIRDRAHIRWPACDVQFRNKEKATPRAVVDAIAPRNVQRAPRIVFDAQDGYDRVVLSEPPGNSRTLLFVPSEFARLVTMNCSYCPHEGRLGFR